MMSRRAIVNFVKNPLRVAETIEKVFEDDLHAKRVLSLANSVVGVLDAAVFVRPRGRPRLRARDWWQ